MKAHFVHSKSRRLTQTVATKTDDIMKIKLAEAKDIHKIDVPEMTRQFWQSLIDNMHNLIEQGLKKKI